MLRARQNVGYSRLALVTAATGDEGEGAASQCESGSGNAAIFMCRVLQNQGCVGGNCLC